MPQVTSITISDFDDNNVPLSAGVVFDDDSVATADFISTTEPAGPPTAAVEYPATGQRIFSIVLQFPQ